jgi:predicted site-specific integrase-resolvase
MTTEIIEDQDQLVSRKQTANLMAVSYKTVQRKESEGHLTPIKLSSGCTRYRLAEVKKLIATHTFVRSVTKTA